jgi:hypothetical protein
MPGEFSGIATGDLGMSAKGSIVVQATRRGLAQEELAVQEEHCKRVKATGSVEAAKPLQARAAVY